MPLHIIKQDITRMHTDAIVNAANSTLLGGGGVDGCIHRAAGPELLESCKAFGGCPTGEARITPGFRLPCRFIIHTVGPVWQGGNANEAALLKACYRNSLTLALAHHCSTVAFPLISAGAYGYPKRQALNIAERTIRQFLAAHEMTVYLVLLDPASIVLEEPYATELPALLRGTLPRGMSPSRAQGIPNCHRMAAGAAAAVALEEVPVQYVHCIPSSLNTRLAQIDESFSQMLLRKIDQLHVSDAECYKRANIDRKLFSKIRSDIHYKPSKTTAVAFAIALKLDRAETDELLRKAGFALSDSSKFDIIIQYFIHKGEYDVLEINEALFAFDQPLLGSHSG